MNKTVVRVQRVECRNYSKRNIEKLTLSGRISAIITNGIGNAPHAATNMQHEKLTTGIHLNALTSTSVELLSNI